MDPIAALSAIILTAKPAADNTPAWSGDNAGAMGSEYADALRGWLRAGGFTPRVEVHPATDSWMSGDRYGIVVSVGREYLTVRMDASGRLRKFRPTNLYGAI